jgi:glycerophosphoryl diester phosphodiesterase
VELITVIGHRGGVHAEPENSLAGFRTAVGMGADGVEFDVRSTQDGELVLMHDGTLKRTAGGSGHVSGLRYSDMGRFKLGNGEYVPTLGEALEVLSGLGEIHLDLKDSESVLPACSKVFGMKLQDSAIFSSSCGPWLLGLKMKYPRARTAFSCDDRRLDPVRIAASLRAESLHISRRLAGRKLVDKAHDKGLKVYVWTVDKPRHARRFLKLGADGLFTNRLDIMLPLMEKLGRR